VAQRPACECGSCRRCLDREYARARRADPEFRSNEAARARQYRAAVRADQLRQEAQRRRRRELYAANAADPDWREERNRRERERRARRRELEQVPGLDLDALAERTGQPRAYLRAALAGELRLGRVVLGRDGCYRLRPRALPADLADALVHTVF
jgi:hypothetical protein